MADISKIEKISKVGQKIAETDRFVNQPNQDYFESLMKQRRVSTETAAVDIKIDPKDVKTQTNSLFDEVSALNNKVDYVTHTSPDQLVHKVDGVIAEIDTLKDKLQTPDLAINKSEQRILKNKLEHIDENLKVAMESAGLEYNPPEKLTSLSGPMDRFLGLLSHSQDQLQTLGRDINALQVGGKELSPANMLLLQIKVGRIQQEIELFTAMLNKALESTKTIMNVQV